MKKTLVLTSALTLFAQIAQASDGVIMKHIEQRIGSIAIVGPNGVDANATAHARFGFAMGLYATEKRATPQSLSADAARTFRFSKRNDSNVIQNCTITVDQLAAGTFAPSCR